jgi:membrane dipeptidase
MDDQEQLLQHQVRATRLLDQEHATSILEQIFPPSDDRRFFSNHRRVFLKRSFFSCIIFIFTIMCILGILIPVTVVLNNNGKTLPDEPILRAHFLLGSQAPLIDAHDDLPWALQKIIKECKDNTVLLNQTLSIRHKQELIDKCDTDLQSDIVRYRKGRVGAIFFSVYTPCERKDNPEQRFVEPAMKIFDTINQIIEKYSDSLTLATTSSQIMNAFRSQKIAILISMEGGHVIQNSLSLLREYYKLGARMMTLTHNCNTDWADSCCDSTTQHQYGLNSFGNKVIREMNRLGMIIDISHTAVTTMKEAIRSSLAPVVFSHSNSYEMCKHVRNVPKSVLQLLIEKDGIIMLSYTPSFVSEQERIAVAEIRAQSNDSVLNNKKIRQWQYEHPQQRATIQGVADHIDYIRNVTGSVDYIGLGSDFNGIATVTKGLEDTSRHVQLIAELIRRGYTDEQVLKISGLNFLRVFREVEKVAHNLQAKDESKQIIIE